MKNIFIEQNLIDKNKSYLQNVYNKLTLSLINVSNVKEEKLNIITDTFFSKYNNQYHTKIDFNNIIQSEENILTIIEK